MHRRSFVPILLAVALAACGRDGPTAVSNSAVSVVHEGAALRLTNLTNEPRAFSAVDPNWLALADLSLTAICATTDATCLRLPANSYVLVPLTSVGGYSGSTTLVVVSTWRVIPNGAGGFRPDADDPITLKL